MRHRTRRLQRTIVGALYAALAFTTGYAAAQDAQEVATAPNNAWVNVSGTVVSASDDSLRLDYGPGVITVEMDDFNIDADGRAIMTNDQVVVYGRVDDDLFEARTIEAGSVYVQSLGTYFHASAADEEDMRVWTAPIPIVVGELELVGVVTTVNGREFTVNFGPGALSVDTSELAYNPMDDQGYQRIEIGDTVKVAGDIDHDLFDAPELMANWIVDMSRS